MEDAPPRPGGTVLFSARALALLEADARVAVACAASDRQLLLRPLEAFGLPVAWYESASTTEFRFRYTRSGRRIMRLEAVGDAWSPEDAVQAVGEARWVHVGALLRSDFPRGTLAALAEHSRTLLVDGQGLIRTSALGPLRSNREIGDILKFIAILKLDESEAEMLAGGTSPEILRSLGIPEVIVTLGPRGSMVITQDRADGVPAVDVEGPVDPTGAGDTFSAAYLFARASDAEPVEAARAGTRAATELLAKRRP